MSNSLEQVQERRQSLDREVASIPGEARQALLEGDDKAYGCLLDRRGTIPGERAAAEVRLLQAQLESRRERLAQVTPLIVPAHEKLEAATEAARVANEAVGQAHFEWSILLDERREIERAIREIEKFQLPAVLSRASKER